MQPWNKSTILLNKVSSYYNRIVQFLKKAQDLNDAGFHMPDDEEPLSGVPNSNLIQLAEQFDIKDEELYNQFESFMDAYKELMNSLTIDSQHLNQETMEDAGQLIDTLNTRWQRIQKNPYLNMTEENGWDEDFSPADLTNFVQKVVEDAGNQLSAIAGQDINIDEMRAAQFAQEFNDNKNIDKGDQNIRWTGDKVQQALEARKKWFDNLMFAKKIGPSHPDYAKYENYIATRRQAYQNIIDNPERKAKYVEQANKRHAKYRAFDERRQEILDQMKRTRNPAELAELQNKLDRINGLEETYKARTVKQVLTNREKKNSAGDFEGLLIHLHQKTESFKSDTSKTIKKNLKKSPELVPYTKAIAAAATEVQNNPTPVNQAKLKSAEQAEVAFITNYLQTHPQVQKVRESALILKNLRAKMKQAYDAGWVNSNAPEEVKLLLQDLIQEGITIINSNIATASINAVIKSMIEQLEKS